MKLSELIAKLDKNTADKVILAFKDKFDVEGTDFGVIMEYFDYQTHTRFDIYLYKDIENIGKRGKVVKKTHFMTYINPKKTNIHWGGTLEDKIKNAKTYASAEKIILDLINEMKDTEGSVEFKKFDDIMKGVDPHLPMSSKEVYESKSGKDISVSFKKPNIYIYSESDSNEAEKSHMYRYIEIKWNYAPKVQRIVEQLITLKGLMSATKLLNENKIKYESIFRMDPQWQ